MIFLIDENLPLPIVERLIADGHEVEFVSELELSMPDSQILRRARRDQVIITEDKGFGGLVFRDQLPTNGVILVRLEGMSMERRAELVTQTVAELGDDLIGSFTVISHGGTRRQPLNTRSLEEGDPS